MSLHLPWSGLFILLFVLTGCAGQLQRPAVKEPSQAWHAREKVLRQLSRWELRGRIAVRMERDGFNANFSWRQWDDNYHIRLSGPFGISALTLGGNRDGVALRSDGKTVFHRGDAGVLFYQQTGVMLPIEALRYWIRGIPQQGRKAKLALDSQGRLKALQQSGWRVTYKRYTRVRKRALELPAKLEVENHQVRVRLVIDHWMFPAVPVQMRESIKSPAT